MIRLTKLILTTSIIFFDPIGARAGGIGGAFSNAAKQLTDVQSEKVFKFKPAGNAGPVNVTPLANGNVTVQRFSPANNEGFGKMYQKEIDPGGHTVDGSFKKWNQEY